MSCHVVLLCIFESPSFNAIALVLCEYAYAGTGTGTCVCCVPTERLPYSIRVLLESVARNCDGFQITSSDVDNILEWSENQHKKVEIPFRPARVILQDFT